MADTYIEVKHQGDTVTNQALLLTLNDKIKIQAALDQRLDDVMELHYIAGMTYKEMSHALNIFTSTLERDLTFAKAWVRKNLSEAQTKITP